MVIIQCKLMFNTVGVAPKKMLVIDLKLREIDIYYLHPMIVVLAEVEECGRKYEAVAGTTRLETCGT